MTVLKAGGPGASELLAELANVHPNLQHHRNLDRMMNIVQLDQDDSRTEQQIRDRVRASFTGESVPTLSENQLTAIIDLARTRLGDDRSGS